VVKAPYLIAAKQPAFHTIKSQITQKVICQNGAPNGKVAVRNRRESQIGTRTARVTKTFCLSHRIVGA